MEESKASGAPTLPRQKKIHSSSLNFQCMIHLFKLNCVFRTHTRERHITKQQESSHCFFPIFNIVQLLPLMTWIPSWISSTLNYTALFYTQKALYSETFLKRYRRRRNKAHTDIHGDTSLNAYWLSVAYQKVCLICQVYWLYYFSSLKFAVFITRWERRRKTDLFLHYFIQFSPRASWILEPITKMLRFQMWSLLVLCDRSKRGRKEVLKHKPDLKAPRQD